MFISREQRVRELKLYLNSCIRHVRVLSLNCVFGKKRRKRNDRYSRTVADTLIEMNRKQSVRMTFSALCLTGMILTQRI